MNAFAQWMDEKGARVTGEFDGVITFALDDKDFQNLLKEAINEEGEK